MLVTTSDLLSTWVRPEQAGMLDDVFALVRKHCARADFCWNAVPMHSDRQIEELAWGRRRNGVLLLVGGERGEITRTSQPQVLDFGSRVPSMYTPL